VRFAPPNSAPLSTTDRSRVSTRGPPALAPADVRLRPVLAS
jgi:hypothetical protein